MASAALALPQEDITGFKSRESVMVGYKHNANVKLEDFVLKMMLGRGTFGKVFLAELP